VGICAGIKILALALFLVDWWLVRQRRKLEEQAAMTIGDVLGSIISLDKCKLHKQMKGLFFYSGINIL
jgi:organic anion transporter 3A